MRGMISRNPSASTLLALLTLIAVVPTEGIAQYSPATNKKGQSATDSTLAIAEFIDGRFSVIGLDGRAQQYDLGSENYFTTSRFSADGTQLVGLGRQGVVVLNDRFERLWQRPLETPNAVSLALSPDGKKIAFAAMDRQTHTVRLVLATSTGPEEVFATFSSPKEAAASWIISWDPTGQQVVFGAEEQVQILDLKTKTNRAIAAGFDPTWSPDGRWIAYRSAEGRLKLFNVTSGDDKATYLDARISSMAHWSPDSKCVFVDVDHGERGRRRGCVSNSRFVICQVSDNTCRAVYDPCGVRDWYFGWISNAAQWIHAAKLAELEQKKGSGKTSAKSP